MLRTRLTFTFVTLLFLATCQGIFTLWSHAVFRHHAERTAITADTLGAYQSLAANKQRLKVWYAQAVLTGEADDRTRDDLIARMERGLSDLVAGDLLSRQLDARPPMFTSPPRLPDDQDAIASLKRNFSALRGAIILPASPRTEREAEQSWRVLIEIFDRSEGRDMRVVLADAIRRQKTSNADAREAMQLAFGRLQEVTFAFLAIMLVVSSFATVYFLNRIRSPFQKLVNSTTAMAHGDLSPRGGGDAGSDEFAIIDRQLERMRQRLLAAQEQAERIREALDTAVADRTRELSKSHALLEDIDRRRREFLADVSHELRTPITVIRGEAEIALRGEPKVAGEYQRALAAILEAAQSLSTRANELLQLASGGLDGTLQHPGKTSVKELIDAALQPVGAIALHHGVELQGPNDMSDLYVYLDHDRVVQALVIVLDNAIRYSDAGSCVRIEGASHEQRVHIRILDHGIGISEEDKQRLFERHFRGEDARRRRADGSGLGLAIARRFVEANGGGITLLDNTPRGTIVDITFPALES
jgi:two-component system, OmpR family, sensor kinase